MKPTQYQEDSLYIENVALSDIARQYGTPVYVYSESALSQAFDAYIDAFS